MLALNVSIPCQTRGLPSCEVATWNLLRKSCNKRACHRVVPATWERGVKGTQVIGRSGGPRVLASSELLPFILLLSLHVPWTRVLCLGSERASPTVVREIATVMTATIYYKNNGPIRSVLLEPLAKRYGLALAAI